MAAPTMTTTQLKLPLFCYYAKTAKFHFARPSSLFAIVVIAAVVNANERERTPKAKSARCRSLVLHAASNVFLA
jgi:hypothetical protein